MQTNWKELIGKRILYQKRFHVYEASEATVLELSPSGEYVKLKIVRSDGTTIIDWKDIHDIKLLEVLEGGE